jgi:hypothetical protein
VTGGKPIAVLLQSVSGVSAIYPLVAFTTSMEARERCYSFILLRTPHLTRDTTCNTFEYQKHSISILKSWQTLPILHSI